MAEFVPITASNGPRIKKYNQVDRIIAGFHFDMDFSVGTSFDEADGKPHLFIYGYSWPAAWKVPEGQSRTDFDPLADDENDEGDGGFIDFLKALAPYLVEPLTVQAVGAEKCRFPLAACEWHVQPGGKRVRIGGFRYSDAQPVVAG